MAYASVALLLLAAMFSIIILIILSVFGLYLTHFKKVTSAVSVTITNDLPHLGKDDGFVLTINDNLPQPVDMTRDFDRETARFCSDLIVRVEMLYYKKSGVTELRMPPDLKNEGALYFNENVIGFVGKSKKPSSGVVWVAFRGTATEMEWHRDFSFSHGDFEAREQTSEHKDFETTGYGSLSCHRGFLDVYSEFRWVMMDKIKSLNPTAVVVTGHSLGASLATLSSIDISRYFPVYSYVFGSPRVCEFIPPVMDAYWRLNNTEDIIPNIPLSIMPNVENKSSPFFYTHGGLSMEFTDNRRSFTRNHTMPVYINAIENRELRACGGG